MIHANETSWCLQQHLRDSINAQKDTSATSFDLTDVFPCTLYKVYTNMLRIRNFYCFIIDDVSACLLVRVHLGVM